MDCYNLAKKYGLASPPEYLRGVTLNNPGIFRSEEGGEAGHFSNAYLAECITYECCFDFNNIPPLKASEINRYVTLFDIGRECAKIRKAELGELVDNYQSPKQVVSKGSEVFIRHEDLKSGDGYSTYFVVPWNQDPIILSSFNSIAQYCLAIRNKKEICGNDPKILVVRVGAHEETHAITYSYRREWFLRQISLRTVSRPEDVDYKTDPVEVDAEGIASAVRNEFMGTQSVAPSIIGAHNKFQTLAHQLTG
jgi:uncharacterized DUF497 family protein